MQHLFNSLNVLSCSLIKNINRNNQLFSDTVSSKSNSFFCFTSEKSTHLDTSPWINKIVELEISLLNAKL